MEHADRRSPALLENRSGRLRLDYAAAARAVPEFLPSDLVPHLQANRLDGTIAVQAAPTLKETEFLLSLSDHTPSILGVVGWLDLFDPAHRSHFDKFHSNPKFIGFRIMIQDMPDASRILEPSFVKALRGYAEEDVPVDLLVRCDQLEPTIRLIHQVPGLRGVLDHIAKPRMKDGELEPWLSHMREAARIPNIRCKLSGMVTEADHKGWRPEHFTVYIRHMLGLFGPDRVLFGSDWPVCMLAAEYSQVVDVLERAIPDSWGETERTKLFGGNAKKFYKL